MNSTTRKIHYLCPFCQKVVHGELTLSTDIKILNPRATSAAVCPDCKVEMIDADALNIPQLQLLHKNGYMTTASCDRYHDGVAYPSYDYSDTKEQKSLNGWCNGPFVGVYNVTKKERKILKEVAKAFNAAHEGEYKADIFEWVDCRDEEIDNVNIGVNGKIPGIGHAVEANTLLFELIGMWLDEIKKRKVHSTPDEDFKPEEYSTLREMPEM